MSLEELTAASHEAHEQIMNLSRNIEALFSKMIGIEARLIRLEKANEQTSKSTVETEETKAGEQTSTLR